MNTFLEYEVEEKYYDYTCLVYPNITYQSDFDKDSFCIIMGNILKRLTKLRPDIHFTVLLPEVDSRPFQLPNVECVLYPQPSYPNTMRCHFDTHRILNIIDWKHRDWDFVYTYLPEHTLALKNVFYNVTNCQPKFFGYSCYIEIPETAGYAMTMLSNHYSGILEMENCGTNSEAVKETILEHASQYLHPGLVDKMSGILQSIPRGWDLVKFDKSENNDSDLKTIVFNHRANSYKSYDWFLKQMDALRKTRQDFNVWVPLADSCERDYIFNTKYERDGYFTKLSKSYIGVCGKSKHKGWANSASDGMAVGLPYIFLKEQYYSEYAKDAGIYFNTDAEFLEKMNEVLDNQKIRDKYSKKCLEVFKDNSWDSPLVMNKYNQQFVDATNKFDIMKETESYLKIQNFILKNRDVSKHDILEYMGWGVRINFTPYRNRLRTHPNIKFTKNRYRWV